ncbi:SpoIIE family protein phosphatase [Kitasatospora terrestris]|uniref:SpoIIE family protein phosphatase n=1 Tax=Kitasatospora terrestris TaxID=258051 RepID=A0ABP9DFS7_9ACTN
MLDADRDEVSAAVLEALFAQSPQGMFLFDEELRVVRYNSTGRGVRGVPPDRILGHTVADFAPGFATGELDKLAREVLRDGVRVRELLVRGYVPGRPEHEMAVAVSMYRIRLDNGQVFGLASVEDVTERQAAIRRLDVLHAAHRRIGASLDAPGIAAELAAVAVPALADAITVDLLDEPMRGLPARHGPVEADAPLRRAAFRSLDGDTGPIGPGELSTFPVSTPFTRSLDDARPRLITHLDPSEPWLDTDPERLRPLLATGIHTVIVVPLTVQDTLLGVVGLYRYRHPEPFDKDDLQLATEVAARAALSIDQARSYARERNIATTLQRHLLPREPQRLSAVDAAHLYLPGAVGSGGDWYDVIPLSGTRVGLAIGAVTGDGIEAAATMGQLRTALRTLAVLDLTPEELLVRLDETARVLAVEQDRRRRAGGRGVASCLYLVYDPVERTCVGASAGHPGPLIVGPDGEQVPYPIVTGEPLGLGDGCYETATLELAEGSVLALHTDGLTSAVRGSDPLGRLARLLARPEREPRALADDIAYGLLSGRQRDDVLLLVARTRALAEDRVAAWSFPGDPAVVATARRLVEHKLAEWGLAELEFATDLIVSELVTNAVRYGAAPIRLRMIRDRELICEVSDSSSSAPHLRRARSTDEGGRGLFIVGQLADRWGTRFSRRGKTIWAEQPVEPAEQGEGAALPE